MPATLIDCLATTAQLSEIFSDRSVLQAMLDFEAALVPEERRATLLANPIPGEANRWSIEIRLQGEAETVFFEV